MYIYIHESRSPRRSLEAQKNLDPEPRPQNPGVEGASTPKLSPQLHFSSRNLQETLDPLERFTVTYPSLFLPGPAEGRYSMSGRSTVLCHCHYLT